MPMSVDELLEAMRALIDAAGDEELSEEDAERYEDLERQLAVARRSQEIRSRQQAYETPLRPHLPVSHATDSRVEEHERAFERYLRTGDKGLLAEFRAQNVGTNSEGGFTVPEVFRQKLVDRLVAFGGVAPEVETITTAGGEDMRFPTLDDTANQGEIAAESTAPAGGADLVFGEITLGAFRYVAPGTGALPLRVSVELLQDSAFDIAALVQRKLGERIAREQADHWVSGAGTTEPFGLDTNTTTTTTFTAAAVTKDALIDALHDVDPAYRGNAVWTFSDGTLAEIRKLEDTTGRPLLQPFATSSIETVAGFQLLGHRVVIDQAWPTYLDGTAQAWGAFGDLREGYVIRRVQDLQLIVNPFSRANEGQVEYTLWARADGNVQNPFSYTVLLNAV